MLVIRTTTWPLKFHTRYSPLTKLETDRLSSIVILASSLVPTRAGQIAVIVVFIIRVCLASVRPDRVAENNELPSARRRA
jgi:hypothetical protein